VCGVVSSATSALLILNWPQDEPSWGHFFPPHSKGRKPCSFGCRSSNLPRRRLIRTAEEIGRGSMRILHLRLAGVGRGVPNPASLIAVGLCLGCGYVSGKSGRCKSNSEGEC